MKQAKTIQNEYTAWAEIDLKAIKHNIKQIAKLSSNQQFHLPTRPRISKRVKDIELMMAVIKGDAYGHGMLKVAMVLEKAGVGFFGVSDIKEGIELRAKIPKKPILIFESTLASNSKQIVDYQLTPTVCTLELAKALNHYAHKKRKKIDIHVKVDTGMGRLGVWYEDAFTFIQKINTFHNLRIMGLFTHFPAADSDRLFTRSQFNCLYDLVVRLDQSGLVIPYIHASNSMGLAGYNTHIVNLARPGLMLYGLYPKQSLGKKIQLKPVLQVQSRVIFLKEVKKGRSISYGRSYFTKKDIRVATIPIGYNDGYLRALSNKASVLIDGLRCPVIGRVTMDQIMVDVTHVKNIKLGTLVTVLGRQKNASMTADELAKQAGTISYEVICSLGNRLPKIYKN